MLGAFQAEHYLSEAAAELEKRDLQQASEKYWGAASQAVKAYAEVKDWEYASHHQLFLSINKIVEEHGDETMRMQFGLANALHINFYEGWLPEEAVRQYGNEVINMVNKIKQLIDRAYYP